MKDKDSYPGVYVDETQSARQMEGVETSGGSGQLHEGSPGASIPGVPNTSSPDPPAAEPVERALSDDRGEAPLHPSDETAG